MIWVGILGNFFTLPQRKPFVILYQILIEFIFIKSLVITLIRNFIVSEGVSNSSKMCLHCHLLKYDSRWISLGSFNMRWEHYEISRTNDDPNWDFWSEFPLDNHDKCRFKEYHFHIEFDDAALFFFSQYVIAIIRTFRKWYSIFPNDVSFFRWKTILSIFCIIDFTSRNHDRNVLFSMRKKKTRKWVKRCR